MVLIKLVQLLIYFLFSWVFEFRLAGLFSFCCVCLLFFVLGGVLKVIYFSSSRLLSCAANSVHVVNMSEALASLGHEVRLIHESADNNSVKEIFDFYGVSGGFSLCPVARPGFRYLGLFLYSFIGFSRYVFGSNADLVYSRDYLGALFCALARYRTVFELHSMPDSLLTKFIFGLLTRCSQLAAVVTISGVLRDDLLKTYPLLAGRVFVAHDAASEHVSIVPRDLGDGMGLKVGYVGGLYPGKGVEIVVELARRMPSLSVSVVGGQGSLLSDWCNKGVDLPNLIFHGFHPPSEIPAFIAAFDIMLLPNQQIVHTFRGGTDIGRWTSPLKMFEYMAAGKPIISSDLPVLREVMRNEHNCLLCTPESVDEWAEALGRLAVDAQLRKRLGDQAYTDFYKNFTWRKRAEQLLSSIGTESESA